MNVQQHSKPEFFVQKFTIDSITTDTYNLNTGTYKDADTYYVTSRTYFGIPLGKYVVTEFYADTPSISPNSPGPLSRVENNTSNSFWQLLGYSSLLSLLIALLIYVPSFILCFLHQGYNKLMAKK